MMRDLRSQHISLTNVITLISIKWKQGFEVRVKVFSKVFKTKTYNKKKKQTNQPNKKKPNQTKKPD